MHTPPLPQLTLPDYQFPQYFPQLSLQHTVTHPVILNFFLLMPGASYLNSKIFYLLLTCTHLHMWNLASSWNIRYWTLSSWILYFFERTALDMEEELQFTLSLLWTLSFQPHFLLTILKLISISITSHKHSFNLACFYHPRPFFKLWLNLPF